MSKFTKGNIRSSSVKAYKASTYQFVFADPVRAGSLDAFKLPSLVATELVPPKARPEPVQGAVHVA
jgi:hypothetical protein